MNKDLNINQIVSIKTFVNATCRHYEYRNREKLFGFVTQKEGFYHFTHGAFGVDGYVTSEKLLSHNKYIIRGEKLVYKPHLDIKTSDGVEHTKYFDSVKELQEFANKIRNINPMIRM